MFRNTFLKSQQAIRQPVTNTMVSASMGLSRALGGKNEKFATIGDYKAIAAKSKSEAVQSLAKFGAALGLVKVGQADEVIEIADSLINNGNLTLARSARSLKARCLSSKLEAARTAALVSGAANEDAVSALTGAVEAELKELNVRGSDWGAKISYAEFLLASPNASFGAIEAFDAAFDALVSGQGQVGKTAEVSNAATLAHLARYQNILNTVNANVTNANVSKLLKDDKQPSEQFKNTLQAYKADLADASIAENEAVVVALAQASAESGHHFLDFFGDGGEYALWSNSFCTPLANRLNGFANPTQSFVPGSGVLEERVATFAKPAAAFNGDVAKLEAALAQEGDVLANITAACGQSSGVATSDAEESYFAMTKMVDTFSAENPPLGHGSNAAESFLLALEKNALEQLGYRAAVGKAVALERNDKLTEAVPILDGVLAGDKYLHMWKALLARGRTHRALGNIDQAEQDFKVLHSLKTQEGFDIPQLDENRYKSIF